LQLAVDGEPDVLARLAGLARQLADDTAIGVDLDTTGSGAPPDLIPRLPMRKPGRSRSGSSSPFFLSSGLTAAT